MSNNGVQAIHCWSLEIEMAHAVKSEDYVESVSGHTQRTKVAVTSLPLALVVRLRRALIVRRQRLALEGLCERMRQDIGLSEADVYREATRSFLDLPPENRRTPFKR
jgi:uncharacterized protein YjiS (DUF1127 family)